MARLYKINPDNALEKAIKNSSNVSIILKRSQTNKIVNWKICHWKRWIVCGIRLKVYDIVQVKTRLFNNKIAIWHFIAVLTMCVGYYIYFYKSSVAIWVVAGRYFLLRFLQAYVGILFVSHSRLWCGKLQDELLMLTLGVCGGSLYFYGKYGSTIYIGRKCFIGSLYGSSDNSAFSIVNKKGTIGMEIVGWVSDCTGRSQFDCCAI